MNKRTRKKRSPILWALVFQRVDADTPQVMVYRHNQTARREFFKQVAYRQLPKAAIHDDGTVCWLTTAELKMSVGIAFNNVQFDFSGMQSPPTWEDTDEI